MRLLLKRSYTPRGTLGRLYLGQRELCLTREAPKRCYSEEVHCLKEGLYELEPLHEEERGWMVSLGKGGIILPKTSEISPGQHELCPFTSLRADGTPMFTRLAFMKLFDELNALWERGEIVEMQIVSSEVPYALETCQIASYS
ncbi:DUF5675 family protein [Algoriphagus sp. CAU 1675]|uniref:DUF5675 family protein n=1 Tax=Algoriphagus sp. CAU 1675 TaxID=3032597 RepID=UPI0023DB802E|nr:DUF5675 family protein [Algoriphagus sp. CAU 1675]MDF2159439.1 DUF5675 family protein [Algoriphagus sp. CAU 1675]